MDKKYALKNRGHRAFGWKEHKWGSQEMQFSIEKKNNDEKINKVIKKLNEGKDQRLLFSIFSVQK